MTDSENCSMCLKPKEECADWCSLSWSTERRAKYDQANSREVLRTRLTEVEAERDLRERILSAVMSRSNEHTNIEKLKAGILDAVQGNDTLRTDLEREKQARVDAEGDYTRCLAEFEEMKRQRDEAIAALPHYSGRDENRADEALGDVMRHALVGVHLGASMGVVEARTAKRVLVNAYAESNSLRVQLEECQQDRDTVQAGLRAAHEAHLAACTELEECRRERGKALDENGRLRSLVDSPIVDLAREYQAVEARRERDVALAQVAALRGAMFSASGVCKVCGMSELHGPYCWVGALMGESDGTPER